MNYYEQFYDDLEFEPEEAYGRRDPHHYPREDRYTRDPYRDDPYFDQDPHHGYNRDMQYEREYERDRHGPDMEYRRSGNMHGYGVSQGRMHEHGHTPPFDHDREYGRMERHSIDNRNERERGCGGQRGNPRGCRGRGKGDGVFEGGGGRGRDVDTRGRGRGNGSRGSSKPFRGGLKPMAFVKSNDADNASQTESNKSENEIRFDFKKFQNEPSQVEIEVEQALKAYKCQLGNGYGYGPRDDLIDSIQQPDLPAGDETVTHEIHSTPEVCNPSPQTMTETNATTLSVGTKPPSNVKTAMINPAFNFVKAKSEFHSIDVAFHETPKVPDVKPTPNSLSVNYANKRVGLGYGVSANKSSSSGSDVSARFNAGLRDGCNARMDDRFAKLIQSVKLKKSIPNKNSIEILHMAVDKVKMPLSDDISSGRTRGGQHNFVCKVIIDGVYVANGQASAKKAAKHEAYTNALKVFENEKLTVKEVCKDVFELRPKDSGFKTPGPLMQGPMKQGNTAAGISTSTKPVTPSPARCSNTGQKYAQINLASYIKPKIVYHQPNHPLNNEPLEFKEKVIPNPTQHGTKNAEALAMKLLNFVKEGQNDNQEQSASSSASSLPSIAASQTDIKRMSRKRPSQMLQPKRVKCRNTGKSDSFNMLEDLSQFILVDSTGLVQASDSKDKFRNVSILHGSANFNKVVLKVEYEDDNDGVNCSLILADIVVSTSFGLTKEEAKLSAAQEALEYLRECCFTIIVKQHVDSDAAGLTKEQLFSDIQKSGGSDPNAAIPNSNVGNLLLRKMGWVGGGVGKDGKGRAEPVATEMVIGRAGLGLQAEKGIGKNFNEKVTKLLHDYIRNDDPWDLHFSSELSKDERAIIHKLGQKLGLKTQSKGSKVKENDRYLIVSRKRNARELLDHIKESGGSTNKYDLIPPNNPDFDITRREDIFHGHYKQ